MSGVQISLSLRFNKTTMKIIKKDNYYVFNLNEKNKLDNNYIKSYLFDNNSKLLENKEFIRQILDLGNLLTMEPIGEEYHISIKECNVMLIIYRDFDWHYFEMKALNVNFTKPDLNNFIESLSNKIF